MGLTEITEEDIEDIADSYRILERGARYYRTGKILSIKVEDNRIIAKVEGNYGNYHVEIWIDEDEVDAECDCPYDGYGCKHIVAVMYKWIYEKESLGKIESNKNPSKTKSWKVNLNTINFDMIKSYPKEKLLCAFELIDKGKIDITYHQANIVKAKVKDGINKYEARIAISNINSFSPFFFKECNCHNFYSRYSEPCEHIVALLLAIIMKNHPDEIPADYENELKKQIKMEKFTSFVNKLDSILPKDDKIPQRKYKILFNLGQEEGKIIFSVQKALLLKRGGLGKPSNVSGNFIENNKFKLSHKKRKVIDLLILSLKQPNRYYNYSDYSPSRKLSKELNNALDIELLKAARNLYLEEPGCFHGCNFLNGKASLEIGIEKNEDAEEQSVEEYVFKLIAGCGQEKFNLKDKKTKVLFFGSRETWICYKQKDRTMLVFELGVRNPVLFKELLTFSDIEIASVHLKDFIEKHYTQLSELCRVVLPEEHKIKEIEISPKPRIFLRDYDYSLSAELKFLYGEKEISYKDKQDLVFRDEYNEIVKIKRDLKAEKNFLSLMRECDVEEKEGFFIPVTDPLEWLADSSKKLIAAGYEIYGQQELVNYRLRSEEPKLNLEVSSGIDWFDLKAEVDIGGEKVPLDKITSALSNHERFIRLSDGSIGIVPKKWLSKLSGVMGLLKEEKKGQKLKAAKSHIAVVEALLEIAEEAKVDKKFKEIREKFKNFARIKEAKLPKKLKGKLRDYQKAGYNWLYFLQEFSFGGCLADEMGLGKTAQALSLLLNEKEKGIKTFSLIVVPTSLLFNWIEEVKKFTPSLKVYLHHGQERLRKISEINRKKADLIITSYGTLRNDYDLFKNKKFHYIVLDESQQIKNPLANVTKITHKLKSKYRLVMTGTPIENNSLDLWSQFAFLNPGFLGSMDYFKKTFAKKIEKEKDKDKTESLKNMINPFLLLRKKETVAKELPDKQITTLYCEMEEKQKQIYEYWKEKYKEEIQNSIREQGFMKSKMKILQGLMRLRQICNHPSLVDESFVGDSGKFNLLIKQIEEVVKKGHKVLIFSSFVKMLKVFKEYFDKEKISYSYLDGSTRKRKEEVEKFQNNSDISVFLISLKAGGLGLNLAAADYVFIVDPWWNPAAEMQAIDRTHRIGQQNKVFVYKAITKDSVEEKILELQENKLDLVKNVITVEEGIFKKLEKEDVNKLFG